MAAERICAWCSKLMGVADGLQGNEVTHGICDECAAYFFSGDDVETLESFLDRLPEPVLVVDADVVVLGANRAAVAVLGKDPATLRGLRGGEVVECAHARRPEGCGRTIHCKACAIRNSVAATYRDGHPRTNIEAYQELADPDRPAKVRVVITTERVGQVVLLRVDDPSPRAPGHEGPA